MVVPLADLKAHCRIDADDDDAALIEYEVAASGYFSSIGIDMDADPLPPELRQAILFLVSHFYDVRHPVGEVSDAEIPFTISALIAPHRSIEI